MECVALALQQMAVKHNPASEEFNLFGRSAFNRYYYAAFLIVRSMFEDMDQQWARLAHAGIPALLRGGMTAELKRTRSQASKLSDHEAVEICNRAIAAAQSLAQLMEGAYTTRVAADYYPSVPVLVTNKGRFSLNDVDITSAHGWPTQARKWTTTISRAWRLKND